MSARFKPACDWDAVLRAPENLDLTAPELAAKIGCCPEAVYRQAKARGVQLRARFKSYAWKALFDAAPADETLNDFCRRAGCSSHAAQDNAVKHGHVFYRPAKTQRWATRFAESKRRRETRTQFCIRFGVSEAWAQAMADRIGHEFAPRVRTKRTAQWAKAFARAAERAP